MFDVFGRPGCCWRRQFYLPRRFPLVSFLWDVKSRILCRLVFVPLEASSRDGALGRQLAGSTPTLISPRRIREQGSVSLHDSCRRTSKVISYGRRRFCRVLGRVERCVGERRVILRFRLRHDQSVCDRFCEKGELRVDDELLQ